MAKRSKEDSLGKTYASRRRAVLKRARKEQPIDAMLITDLIDIRYLCGVTEGSHSLLFGDDWGVILTHKMFQVDVGRECHGAEVIVIERHDGKSLPPDDAELRKQAKQRKLDKIGYQADLIAHSRYKTLSQAVGAKKLVESSGLVVGVRAIKDEAEIAVTRRAVKIAESAFRQLTKRGADYFVGKTERELAAELEYLMRNGGADRQGFPQSGIIVAAGPNSASCHHFPTQRKVRRGDAVLFDWGAELDGYRSDITRVVFVGDVPAPYPEIYPIVEKAFHDTIAAVRPGVRNHKLDKITRDVLQDAGHDLIHGLGHGIGLQIHEQPRLTAGPPEPLKRNMIITIEPGLYFHGQGGLRLEDDILVTADGYENLCSLPTTMRRMILK